MIRYLANAKKSEYFKWHKEERFFFLCLKYEIVVAVLEAVLHLTSESSQPLLALLVAVLFVGHAQIVQQRDQIHVVTAVQASVHVESARQIVQLELGLLVVAVRYGHVVERRGHVAVIALVQALVHLQRTHRIPQLALVVAQ